MVDNASRREAVDLSTILMFTAFAFIGGFLFWLMGEAHAQRESRLLADATEVASDDFSMATTVAAVDLQTDPTPFEGQLIRVAGLTVASTFGTQGFWLQLPNRNPFLISMSEQVMAEGLILATGQPATAIGTLHAMSDSTVTAWGAAGTIDEGDQLAAEFAGHYLEADQVVVASGPGGDDNDGGAGN
jgi:hypothetical protein